MYRLDKSNQPRVKHNPFDSKTPTFSSSFFHQINESLTKNPPHKSISYQHDLQNRGMPFNENKIPSLSEPPFPKKCSEKKINGKVKVHRNNPSFYFPSSPELDLQDSLFFSSSETEHSVSHHHPAAISSRLKIDLNCRIPTQQKGSDNDKDMIFGETRSRVQKIYSNLKKLKQPISPGARLTSLISSLFEKESKPKSCGAGALPGGKEEGNSEICSSLTSCLSRNIWKNKSSEDHRGKRTARCFPMGMINIADSPPSDEQRKKTERGKLQKEKQRELEKMALDLLNGYWDCKLNVSHNQMVKDEVNHDHDGDDEDDDGMSCSSSDLFEIDHLSLMEDELPVYETTHFDPKFI